MFICGTKEKYRELRDLHAVEMHLSSVMKLCKEGGLPLEQVVSPGIILPYDTLLSIVSIPLRGKGLLVGYSKQYWNLCLLKFILEKTNHLLSNLIVRQINS